MSQWGSTKARRVLAALSRLGWPGPVAAARSRTLRREGFADFVFAFHDGDEIGPRMVTRIAKHTGLKREDL